MPISETRLTELRAMPYEEYLLTREWQATRKRILKRDSYTCQGCFATGVVLHVHHWTYERLGAEENEDLIALCQKCHDEIHGIVPTLPFLHKVGIFGGVATIGTIGLEGFLQAPLPAEIGMLVGAYFLAKSSPALYGMLKNKVPPEVFAWLGIGRERQEGQYSVIERWTGKPLRDQQRVSEPTDEAIDAEVANCVIDENDVDADDDSNSMRELNLEQKRMRNFSELLKTGWRPTMDKIYIGTDAASGKHLFLEASKLFHVALAGATGHGKSSVMRLLLVQLCYLKLPVILLNPHYMIYDKDHNEDWTPFTPFLQKDPMVCKEARSQEIVLAWLYDLLEKRKERTSRGLSAGKPFFIILDEYPDIVAEVKDAPKYIGKLLRQGRKYGIFLIIASQSYAVKTLGVEGEGEIRKSFWTTFYVGGDSISAKELLNLPAKDIPEGRLKRGDIMLRYADLEKAIEAFVPYVDNEAIYLLLGKSTFVAPEEERDTEVLEEVTTVTVTANVAQKALKNGEFDRRNGYGYGRNDDVEPASEEAVRGQNEAVTVVPLPTGWTDEKVALLPGLYRVFDELDACLKALEFSTSQRNRDFARDTLKQQGLWKG